MNHTKVYGILIFLLAICLLASNSIAQTNTFPSSGNVGIGTTNPSNIFTVQGNPANTQLDVVKISNGANNAFTSLGLVGNSSVVPSWADGSQYLEFAPYSSGNGIIDTYTGSLLFQTNRNNRIAILPNGNVGVGTTSPNYLLDVAGQIHSSTGGIIFPDGSAQTTAYNPNGNMTINGNIGIGVADPINALSVKGYSQSTQAGIATFINGTNGAYTAFNSAGSSSIVPTWNDGSQILEFVPYSSGNGIIGTFTGNLLFQTNNRTTQMSVLSNGNVGIGTGTPGAMLDVAGNVKVSGSGASITFPDGSIQSTAWNGTLGGGDYAESVNVLGDRKKYEPGDVLVIDPTVEGKFIKSAEPYSTSVVGIYSTKPGLVGRRQVTPKSFDEVPMAMMGIVPTKVSAENGSIHPGDLLVSSSIAGYAMKGTDRSRMVGALIGKAIGSIESGTGVIEVAVTLQ